MEVQAKLRHLRLAPRKVRLVVDMVRGLPARRAIMQLRFVNKTAALPVRKLLESAVANACHNFELDPETLVIKRITADSGPTFTRFRARAFGRAAPIRKRMTHVTVVLEGEGSAKGGKGAKGSKGEKGEKRKKGGKKSVKKS